jgi:hypothetical protein
MKNKYLAVVLSLVVVIVVVYLVISGKSTEPLQRQLHQPAPQTQHQYSTGSRPGPSLNPARSASPGTAAAVGQGGPIIDYHSEILLERIQPELAEPYPKRELPLEFGTIIFSRRPVEASPQDHESSLEQRQR